MCTRKVTLEFPDYSSGGAFLTSDAATKAKWKDVAAYNAKVLDPCRDDCTFGEVKFPIGQNNDLYTPKKLPGAKDKTHFKYQWETEHVMDAQIVTRFMQDMFESRTAKIRTSMIPKMWKNSGAGDGYARSYVYNQCSYLESTAQACSPPTPSLTSVRFSEMGPQVFPSKALQMASQSTLVFSTTHKGSTM